MKKINLQFILSFVFMCIAQLLFAQIAAVKVTVKVPYDTTTEKHIYIAGSFNGWKSGDSLYQLHPGNDGLYSIMLPLFDNTHYAYKYTRGNWNSVEVSKNDSDITNRRFVSKDGLMITDTVAGWKREVKSEPSPQMVRINAMKDSTMKVLQPQLNDLMNLLKSYTENWLSDHPSNQVQKKLDIEGEKKLNYVYEQIIQLLGNAFAILSPDQKVELKKVIDSPPQGNDNFLNTLGKGLQKVTNNSK